MDTKPKRILRRRRQSADSACTSQIGLEGFLDVASQAKKLVIFSGSGLSASSGMSMFTTKNGLYERARKRFKVSDGMKLFTYSFYKQHKLDVQAFFAQIYSEAQASQAAAGHYAIAQLHAAGLLQRHYTLNIDGLSEVVGLDSWHHECNPQAVNVELHGNIRQLVCPKCGAVEQLTRTAINQMKLRQAIPCKACTEGELRFRIVLYDDDEGEMITHESVFDLLASDMEVADMILWVGISFEQSASTEYFRKVRTLLGEAGRSSHVKQVIINPNDEAVFNVVSSCCNKDSLDLLEVRLTSEDVLPALAERLSTATNPEDVAVPSPELATRNAS